MGDVLARIGSVRRKSSEPQADLRKSLRRCQIFDNIINRWRASRTTDNAYFLDTTELDSSELLCHIAFFLPDDVYKKFRKLRPDLRRILRPKAVVPTVVVKGKHTDSSMPLALLNHKRKPIKNFVQKLAKCDIECCYLCIDKSYNFASFTRIPRSLVVKTGVYCHSVHPEVLPFIHEGLMDVKLYHTESDLSISYPFALQEVLDRIVGTTCVFLSVCHFTDSANWKEIVLRWAEKQKFSLFVLIIVITGNFTPVELDDFLKKLLPFIPNSCVLIFKLSWSSLEVLNFEENIQLGPKSKIFFDSIHDVHDE